MDRAALIARKDEVRRQLVQSQREVVRVETRPVTWRTRRQLNALQEKIDRLMAEEHNLRLAIDRAGQGNGR